MAKQLTTYLWGEIKKDFELGMSQADIRKKYDVGAGTLGNKIKRDGWRLSQAQNEALSEFKEATVKISESFHGANESQKKEMTERVITIIEDNELVGNNRKIAKMLQGIIVSNRQSINLNNMRNVSGVMKDIESIANPQSNKQEINVNATAAVQNNSITVEFVD